MSRRILVTLAALALLLMPTTASAVPLLPLQLGGHNDYDGADAAGHAWQYQMKVVAQNISLSSKTYFHLRSINADPYDTTRANPQDMLIRCDDTHAYLSMGGSEAIQFQTGPTSTSPWTTLEGQSAQITSATSNIIVPAGTFNPSYENRFNSAVPGSQPWYAYLYPGTGIVKQVDQWVAAGRAPATLSLRSTGVEPVKLFPLKSGMKLTFNASDSAQPTPRTWQMQIEVLNQVTLNDGLIYFRMRQVNFDPFAGEVNNEFYARCTASQMYARKIDENPAHLEWQTAGPGTAWNFPQSPYTIYKRINSITPIEVLGGLYLAYVTQQAPNSSFPQANSMYEYVVPGLGPVYMEDYWIADSSRAPLKFSLDSITQGSGSGAAMNLLLLD